MILDIASWKQFIAVSSAAVSAFLLIFITCLQYYVCFTHYINIAYMCNFTYVFDT